ncbi:hypothetical protein T05_12990 [Trichinella murrelli]|uniref:Uncharacterized protein n=1 Tax=Trichinella murrelli TaxID=144512 RepID=A0A0V0T2J4_9BILA|nr:hypothetical protein T05_12990 [Trichinella murrelli]
MVSTPGGLTHSGTSIPPRSPFVAPSGVRLIRTICDIESLLTGRARRMTISIHHTTCYSTLTTSFLPPVDLQKGERDTQVQFRGRRHNTLCITGIN